MLHPDQIKEAEAYCAEQNGQLGDADNNTQIMLVIKERDDLLNSLAATCRERDGLRQLIADLQETLARKSKDEENNAKGWAASLRENDWLRGQKMVKEGSHAMDNDFYKKQLEAKENRITELEGKIARAKGLLIGAGQAYSPTRTMLNIDAALKELQ